MSDEDIIKNIYIELTQASINKAIEKANNEYEKFRIKQDKEYISSMDKMYKRYLEENKIGE